MDEATSQRVLGISSAHFFSSQKEEEIAAIEKQKESKWLFVNLWTSGIEEQRVLSVSSADESLLFLL